MTASSTMVTIPPLPAGIHHGIPAERYHHASLTVEPALTAGMAIALARSGPARAWVWRHAQSKHSDIMDFGCAAHIAALEPHLLDRKVVVVDAPDWRTKAARAMREEAYANHQYPLLPPDYDKLEAMAAAMRNTLPGLPFNTSPAEAIGIFEYGHGEVTLVAGGTGGQPWMKARPDYLKTGGVDDLIVDYKTTGLSGRDMWREARNRRWDIRAAFYCDVYRRAAGRAARYLYLVQETEWPHFVYAYTVPRSDFRQGAADAAAARITYRRCMASGAWPSDVDGIRVLEPIN